MSRQERREAGAGKPGDDLNRAMVDVWDIDVPDTADVRSWVHNGSAQVPWQRWLYWKRELGLGDRLDTIELGCGYGKFSLLLALSGARVTLFDYSAAALDAASTAHAGLGLSPRVLHGDLLELPDGLLGRFDVACSLGTLEHFFGANRRRAVAATASVLKPGGVFFVTVPNRHAVWYRLGFGLRQRVGAVPNGMKEQPYGGAELTRLVRDCGIEILEVGSVNSFWGDFDHWIGDNARSLARKLTGRPRPRLSKPPPVGLPDVSVPRDMPRRSYLDRRFSYSLMLIGRRRPEG